MCKGQFADRFDRNNLFLFFLSLSNLVHTKHIDRERDRERDTQSREKHRFDARAISAYFVSNNTRQ